MKKKFLFFSLIFILSFVITSSAKALAAVKCWHGSAGANWNVDANWVTTAGGATTQPGASDIATFDSGTGQCSSGVQNTNVNIPSGTAISVAGINITSNYTQTITQTTTATITVGASSWVQAGGIFTGGSGAITITTTGDFNFTGGTFTSTSGTFTVADEWTASGTFSANSGTVVFTMDGDGTEDTITGSITLNNLTFQDTGCANTQNAKVASGTILTVNGTLYFNETPTGCGTDYINGPGQIYAKGNITTQGDNDSTTFQGFTGNLIVTMNGTSNQTLSGTDTDLNDAMPGLTIDKASGNVTITNGIAVGCNFTLTQLGGGGVINGSGTLNFAPSDQCPDITITGTVTLPNIAFEHIGGGVFTGTIASGTTLTSSGDLTFKIGYNTNSYKIAGPGNIVFQGNLTMDDGTDNDYWDGNVAISLTGSNTQTITDNDPDSFPTGTVTFNKSGGSIALATNWSVTAPGQDLLVAASSTQTLSGAHYLFVEDQLTISGTLNQTTGIIQTPDSGTITVSSSGVWTDTAGQIVLGGGGIVNNGSISFDGTPAGCGDSDGITIISTNGGQARTWSGGGAFYLVDVSMQDQTTSLGLNVYSSTSVSGNSGFTFNSGCPSGSIAYWQFEEGHGTTAHDSTSTRADATLAGSTLPVWKTEDFCVSGKCLYLDGTTSTVTANIAFPGVKSVGLWVKPLSVSTTALIDLDGGTHKITVSSGTVTASGFSSPTVYVNGVVANTITANTWSYVEVTTSSSFLATAITMGKSGSTYMQGFIDEVRLFDTTRSASLVKVDFVSRGDFSGTSTVMGSSSQSPSFLSNGLIGYWNIDDLGSSAGNTNYGLTTQGSSGDSGNGNLLLAQKITVTTTGTLQSLTFEVNSAVGDLVLGIYSDSGGNPDLLLAQTNAFTPTGGNFFNTQNTTTNPTLTPGDYWITYLPQSSSLTFYQTSGSGTFKVHNSSYSTTMPSSFGSIDDSGSTNWTFYATVNSTVNLSDQTGNSSLTNNGSTTGTAGYFGNAASFNGSSKYFSDASTLSNVYSVSFWAKPASSTDNFINLASGVYINASSGTLSATGFTNPIIYVNGIRTSSISSSAWQLITISTTTPISANAFEVGRANGSYATNNSLIDDVRVYSRALTASDVLLLYNWSPGPVGYWNFDENSGTSAYDTSGNANNGTISGNVIRAPGKYGGGMGALDDTAQDAMTVTDPSSGILDFSDTQSFTYGAWIKTTLIDTGVYVISKGYSGNPATAGYTVDISHAGGAASIACQFSDGTGSVDDSASLSSSSLENGNWHYISCVMDRVGIGRAAGLYLYYDGVAVASDTTLTEGTAVNSSNLVFGENTNVANDRQLANGRLDEFRIYNYARSPKQIVQDMNAGHPAGGSPVGSQLIYWPFDELTGSGAGSVHNVIETQTSLSGNLTGATWNAENGTVNCKLNGCLSFGTSTNNVSAGNITTLDSSPAFSLSFWVNPSTLAVDKAIVSKSDFSTKSLFAVNTDHTTSSELRVYIANAVNDTGSNYFTTAGLGLVTSAWQHIVMVYDGTQAAANRVKIYKNGKLSAGSVTGTIPATTVANSASNFKVGASDSGTYTALNTYIDEVKVYTSALTQSEALVDATNGSSMAMGGVLGTHDNENFGGSPPVGWWKFDDVSSATVTDSSGNGYTGTWSGSSVQRYAVGKLGGAGKFNDSALDCVSNASITTTLPFSFSAWVYPTSLQTGNLYTIARKATIAGGDVDWYIRFREDAGTFKIEVPINTTGGVWTSTYGITTITPNNWYHVGFTLDGSSHLIIYLNGNVEATANLTLGTNALNSDFTLSECDGISFSGLIDNAKLYNYARSPTQVSYDYNRGAPIGWWEFDECSGTTAHDSSGNGVSGVITPGNATGNNDSAGTCSSGASNPTNEMWNAGTTGKINASLSFDGTNDYVDYGDVFDFNYTDTRTFCAWIYPTSVASEVAIISKNNWNPDYDGWLFEVRAGGGLAFAYINTWSNDAVFAETTAGLVSTNTWQHVCAVYDNTAISFYKNGLPYSKNTSLSFNAISHSINNSTSMNIGGRDDGSGFLFPGQIDDVRIYNYAISATQAKQLYNNAAAQRFSP